jgi:hypothetical protein
LVFRFYSTGDGMRHSLTEIKRSINRGGAQCFHCKVSFYEQEARVVKRAIMISPLCSPEARQLGWVGGDRGLHLGL